MKSKRSLMTALVGFAMLATPITAAAYDNDHYAHNDSHAAHVSRSSNAPARFSTAPRNVGPADVTRHEVHNNNVPAIAGRRGWGTADEYQNYGRNYRSPGYYRAPGYAAPAYPASGPYYGAPGYAVAGNGCRQAQSVVNNYYRDRNTGHPAAAADLLARNQWAFRSGCGGGASYSGGMLGGLGGLGGYGRAPAYGNYGGYNGGYGQPYGGSSMLGPLIQQFVR